MMIVLADDFSGATEIAGVGHRLGLQTEIQLNLDLSTEADLLVVDTNTRSLKEEDAVKKLTKLVFNLKKSGLKFKLFKKVDSVMRGHLIPEIDVIRSEMGFRRVLLLPANPHKGRKIVSGHYEVNDVRLNKTVFASDPDYPMNTSSIHEILNIQGSDFPHVHVNAKSKLPDFGLITGDVESRSDLEQYISEVDENDLCCGASAFFEVYLEKYGSPEATKKIDLNHHQSSPKKLIINGSTVKSQSELKLFGKLGIPRLPFPGHWQNDLFILKSDDERIWVNQVLDMMDSHPCVAVSIDHIVKPLKDNSQLFSKVLITLLHQVLQNMKKTDLHFGLTGGATAFDLIQSTGMDKYHVLGEVLPGVVTIKGKTENRLLFTVKPGSYEWSEEFLK